MNAVSRADSSTSIARQYARGPARRRVPGSHFATSHRPPAYTAGMQASRGPLRERFEVERRRAAFFSFLAGAGIGIIVTDTWLSHWFGVVGGFVGGGVAYG